MYRKETGEWLKHADFILLDMVCLQLALVLAFVLRIKGIMPYESILYRNMAVFLGLADLAVIACYGTMKDVLKRGHYREFVTTLRHSVMVGALAVVYISSIRKTTGSKNIFFSHEFLRESKALYDNVYPKFSVV